MTATGLPPEAETRRIGLPICGAKRMTSPGPQVAPRPLGASQIAAGGPPFASIRHSFPFAKKPMKFPSGDQKGKKAPLVPGSSSASILSRERTHNDVLPARLATNAMRFPSGENAGGPLRFSSANCVPSSGSSVARITCLGLRVCHHPVASAMTATASTASAVSQNAFLFRLLAIKAGTPARDPVFVIHSSCSFMSCAV